MMSASHYLACDLGAESGRVMLGTLENGTVTLKELHRFPSAVVKVCGTMRWDVLRIFEELKVGMRAASKLGLRISGISTDSWGVDYVLLRAGEPQVSAPFHYRDARTDDGFERVFAKVDADTIFERTGIQFMTLNTLYQFFDDVEKRPELLAVADGFLNIADYFNFLMSGVRTAEESLASTTQIYDPRKREWARDLAEAMGFPIRLFPAMVPSGTRLGPLLPEMAVETGLDAVEVIATCSHDTGAAVTAVPAEGTGWAYLSSGTWSLLGIESPEPIITKRSRELNFTNEAGHGGTTRFLKNMVGLWIVQECRRTWASSGRDFNYDELTSMAEASEPLRSLIFPNAPRFGKPGGMPEKIADFCRESGQPVPESPGQFVRCALESLALLYRLTISELESASSTSIDRIHIVGGGSRNTLLNQLAANATGRRILAGPVEATALGNVLIQALAMGRISSVTELRKIVAASYQLATYEPCAQDVWKAAHARFDSLPKE